MIPRYIKGTALAKAVDAYDAARCAVNEKAHGGKCAAMSDANKDTIAPMIMEAIVAWHLAIEGETELRGGVLA